MKICKYLLIGYLIIGGQLFAQLAITAGGVTEGNISMSIGLIFYTSAYSNDLNSSDGVQQIFWDYNEIEEINSNVPRIADVVPNPFLDDFSLNLYCSQCVDKIAITDLSGKELIVWNLDFQNQGHFDFINNGSIQSGLYLVKITYKEKIEIKKIIKL